MVEHKSVQTDFNWEVGEQWTHSEGPSFAFERFVKPPQVVVPDLDAASVGLSIGAHSLPIHMERHTLDGFSIVSENDGHTVKSANVATSFSAIVPPRKYNRKGRRHIIHPLDAVLAEKLGSLTSNSNSRAGPAKKKMPPQDKDSGSSLFAESDIVAPPSLADISVAGRKFMPPIILPRI